MKQKWRNAPLTEGEERVVTFTDIRDILFGQKKKLLSIAIYGAIYAFCAALLIHTPSYKITAIFKEAPDNSSNFKNPLLHVLGEFQANTASTGSQAALMIVSNPILEPVIEQMGLQAKVKQSIKTLFPKVYCRIRDNILAEINCILPNIDDFIFCNVTYTLEKTESYSLRFDDPNNFSVFKKTQEITKGSIGEETHLPNASFTLLHTPNNLMLKKNYTLLFHPLASCSKKIRSLLKIKQNKENQAIYHLHLVHRNRNLGVQLLNNLMNEYRNYLKNDFNKTSNEQIVHLQSKQNEFHEQISKIFDEHANYLQRNFAERGFFDLKDESAMFRMLSKDLVHQIHYIDNKLNTLNPVNESQEALLASRNEPFFNTSQERIEELHNLIVQRNLLRHTLKPDPAPFAEPAEDTYCAQNIQKDLENYALHTQYRPLEFRGLDQKTMQELFAQSQYSLAKDRLSTNHFNQLSKELLNDTFEISSLSTVLTDPLSQRLIQQANDLALKLRDINHYSAKEGDRWKEELSMRKQNLADHLNQLSKVEQIHASMNRKQVVDLQHMFLQSLNERISVLNESIHDSIKEYKQFLSKEKELLQKKIEKLRTDFTNIPEKWKKENWFNLKTELETKIMKSITELVATKTMERSLHHIESKPLEFATKPLFAMPPKLFLFAFLGGFFTSLLSFLRLFFNALLKGFPCSDEKLQALNYPFLGKITPYCNGPSANASADSDLELLRHISLFLQHSKEQKIVGIISGKGPDYSYALAQHLSRISKKSLIIRCDFQSANCSEDLPGLVQIWEGKIKTPPIQKGSGYDFLAAGGCTQYGAEVLQSPVFQELLDQCAPLYDYLFLFLNAPLDRAESIGVLRFCNTALVTVCKEPIEQLTPFIGWAYYKDMYRLQFITLKQENHETRINYRRSWFFRLPSLRKAP